MTKTIRTITPVLLTLAFFIAMAGPATASEGKKLYDDEIAEEAELSADDVKDDHLRDFHKASTKITEIRKDYSEKIREADADEGADLQKEAADEMASAVEDTDLSVDEYREIGYLIQNEDKVKDQLNKALADS